MSEFNKLKRQLEAEENLERQETVDSIMNEIKRDKINTEKAKKDFINEMKYGFGKEMRKNPNAAVKIKRSFWYKLKNNIIKFFKHF